MLYLKFLPKYFKFLSPVFPCVAVAHQEAIKNFTEKGTELSSFEIAVGVFQLTAADSIRASSVLTVCLSSLLCLRNETVKAAQ